MCNAACVKIIINSGFMAVLASQVEERYGPGSIAGFAAVRLHIAATTLIAMAKARGLSVGAAGTTDDFDGCAQASAMVHWITDAPEYSAEEIAKQMDGWTTDLWQHIADLAAGKPLA